MKRTFLAIIYIFFAFHAFAQNPQWKSITDGLGGCNIPIGSSGQRFDITKDTIRHIELLEVKNEAYASIIGKDSCIQGLFKLDTFTQKWKKVAQFEFSFKDKNPLIVTDHKEILLLNTNDVYQYTTDYINYPKGWKKVSSQPISDTAIESALNYHEDCLGQNLMYSALDNQLYSDTLYSLMVTRHDSGGCNSKAEYNTFILVKLSLNDGKWHYLPISMTPRGQAKIRQAALSLLPQGGYIVFLAYKEAYKKLEANVDGFSCGLSTSFKEEALPKAVYQYKSSEMKWQDISRGPNWCISANKFATGIQEIKAFEGTDELLMINYNGTWHFDGEKWHRFSLRINPIISADAGKTVIREGRNGYYADWVGPESILTLSPPNDTIRICKSEYHNDYKNIISLNNYTKFIGVLHSNVACISGLMDSLKPSNNKQIYYGIYQFNSDTNLKTKTNLELHSATYLGGAGDNQPIGIAFGGSNTLFTAGNFPEVLGKKSPNFFTKSYNGSDNTSRGKIIITDHHSSQINGVINLGNEIYDFETQNNYPYNMVVQGDFGTEVIDTLGSRIWNVYPSPINVSVDIDHIGNVVVLDKSGKRFYVYDKNGILKNSGGSSTNAPSDSGPYGNIYNTQSDFVTDVAIMNDTIFVSGFNNDKLNGVVVCGESTSLPVQSTFIRAFANKGNGKFEMVWRSYDLQGDYLGLDQADTRVYKLNIGLDGNLYIAGETAGPNGVFRWNGKTTVEAEAEKLGASCNQGTNYGTKTLIEYDQYSTAWGNCGAPHITYFARINSSTGIVNQGQYLFSRRSNNCINTFRAKEGYIHADKSSTIYFGAKAYAFFPNRFLHRINGLKIGDYAGGDGAIAIIRPDFKSRYFLGNFSDSAAESLVVGIALRDSSVAVVLENYRGKLFTGSRYLDGDFKKEAAILSDPPNLQNTSIKDAYIATWKINYSHIITATHFQEAQDNIVYYPNPVQDYLRFEGNEFEGKKINIYDFSGRNIKMSYIQNNQLNMSDIKTGSYLLKVKHYSFIIIKE